VTTLREELLNAINTNYAGETGTIDEVWEAITSDVDAVLASPAMQAIRKALTCYLLHDADCYHIPLDATNSPTNKAVVAWVMEGNE